MFGWLGFFWVVAAVALALSWSLYRNMHDKHIEARRKREAFQRLMQRRSPYFNQTLSLHRCGFGHEMGISNFCATCTEERRIRTKDFSLCPPCPQCGDVANHPWAGMSTESDDFEEHGALKQYVVRHCDNCKYEWRQS